MSIFRRESPAPVEGPSGEAPARRTQIAAGSCLRGEVTGATEVVVEGEVRGAIRVESTVVVGAGGLVEGPIQAKVVRVAGRVVGDVCGVDRVEVGDAATLEGDIAAPRVIIAEGAFFRGKVQMQGDKARDGRPAGAAAEPGRSG
jgi:cytoskeletal protein CcmA (bactofilin family)